MALPAFITRRIPPDRYTWWVGKGMDRAYRRAAERPTVDRAPVEVDALKAVVFSDHHRGDGDAADDFRRCEETYAAAIGWYLEQGYELWLLGDVEELWENRTSAVMQRYEGLLRLEARFGDRLLRFYGNHDLSWRDTDLVRRFLPGTAVHEAMTLTVTDGGNPLGRLFLAHGHQGTIDSGNLLLVPVSRFVVRFIWGTLQRWRGFPNTSPVTDELIRHRHDQAMARWADTHEERVVLVAGHTHHPVFLGTEAPDLAANVLRREAEYRAAQEGGDATEVAAARARLEQAKVRALREVPYEAPDLEGWSYFNSGCCSYADGDITGLEFAEGEVRLVRWKGNQDRPAPRILQRRGLREVFGTLTGTRPDRAAGGAGRRAGHTV